MHIDEDDSGEEGKDNICIFYMSGICTKGDDCNFKHPKDVIIGKKFEVDSNYCK
jgi:hypothetical protein